jgi:hypothetical protein
LSHSNGVSDGTVSKKAENSSRTNCTNGRYTRTIGGHTFQVETRKARYGTQYAASLVGGKNAHAGWADSEEDSIAKAARYNGINLDAPAGDGTGAGWWVRPSVPAPVQAVMFKPPRRNLWEEQGRAPRRRRTRRSDTPAPTQEPMPMEEQSTPEWAKGIEWSKTPIRAQIAPVVERYVFGSLPGYHGDQWNYAMYRASRTEQAIWERIDYALALAGDGDALAAKKAARDIGIGEIRELLLEHFSQQRPLAA